MKNLITMLFALSMILALPSCSADPEDVCAAECDCEGCSQAQFNSCVDDFAEDEFDAERRGCLDLFDVWIDCREETAICDRGDYETFCKPERERFKRCIDD